jgi:hypothetical protein
MPFDERTTAALSALRPHIAVFRFFVSATLERARKTLVPESEPGHARVSLGNFASGRIDPKRFAMVSSGAIPLDNTAYAVIERTAAALESILSSGDEQFVVDVPAGGSASEAIQSRLTSIGAAFGAGAVVELVRRRAYDPLQHGAFLQGRPFSNWSAGERKLAPPLVVRLQGRDVDPFALGPFMDGCLRLVLVVDEPCAPAPLARLISPGVFVAQTNDAKVLDKLSDLEAPAIIAIMNDGEARFVHDPRAGLVMWQRIQVTRMPDALPRKSLGSRSAWQQREDVAHLKSLVEPPKLPSNLVDSIASGVDGGITDPVERLTAWLLEQSSRAGVA